MQTAAVPNLWRRFEGICKLDFLSSENLMTLAQIEAEKSVTECFVREKEKWTNKETDKPYVAIFLLLNTTCHCQALYQISKS